VVFTVFRLVPNAASQESSFQIKNFRIIQRLGEKQPCASFIFIIRQLDNINILITYDLLLHVSKLIRHLQGALHAWLLIVVFDKLELLKYKI
jgi:hypothetical protein